MEAATAYDKNTPLAPSASTYPEVDGALSVPLTVNQSADVSAPEDAPVPEAVFPSESPSASEDVPGSETSPDVGDAIAPDADDALGADVVLVVQGAPFQYQHDPRDNPSAMEDIVVAPDAVYDFEPNETGSLKQFATADWSDTALVEAGRQQRIAYHESLSVLYGLLRRM